MGVAFALRGSIGDRLVAAVYDRRFSSFSALFVFGGLFFLYPEEFLLFQQVIQEEGVPFEVASGEAAGFRGEAVGPCEACELHQSWGVGFGAGIDIEGEADGKEDSAGEEGLEALEEFLLFWCAKADPEEVGATGND